MINKLSFYISDCHNPYTNLATEKYLLDSVGNDEIILYLWQNQNTVVIGKNQNALTECNCALLEEDGGHLARRLSGGGSVFHDLGNLNFTFLCRTENYDLSKQMQVIKEACVLGGISAEISGRNDILADGRKFSGNAFYNSRGKSYHHGTILINADMEKMARYLTPPKAKLEAKGVKSVKSRTINLCTLSPTLTCNDMKNYMAQAFKEVYSKPITVINTINNEEIFKLAEKYKVDPEHRLCQRTHGRGVSRILRQQGRRACLHEKRGYARGEIRRDVQQPRPRRRADTAQRMRYERCGALGADNGRNAASQMGNARGDSGVGVFSDGDEHLLHRSEHSC